MEIILITEKALCTKGISHSIVLFGLKKKGTMYIHWMEYYVAFKYVYLKQKIFVKSGNRIQNVGVQNCT